MPGPAPKPDATRRRRNAPLANTVQLPAEGRSGRAPEWPLAVEQPETWIALWRTPQAVAWERLGWFRTVARYALLLERVEDPDKMSAALLTVATQLEDRLGLTPMSMLRLRWEVASDEVAELRTEKKEAPAASARRRLKVAGDAVAGS